MLVIAHRGASRRFPENSLLAFEQAILQAADGIELDVHFHPQSQQYIVLHDAYLEKTTNSITFIWLMLKLPKDKQSVQFMMERSLTHAVFAINNLTENLT